MSDSKSKVQGPLDLTDEQLPEFISRAALTGYRNWKGRAPDPRLTGSPGFKPSPSQARTVSYLTSCGLTPGEVGRVLNIEVKLLQFYYKYELDSAKLRTNASVGRVALKMALSGNDSDMTRFWLKTQAGWKETQVHEHSGIDAAADEAAAARRKLLGGDEPNEGSEPG